MPRPSLAQTIYGSATVTVTAFVLLLLTQTGSSAVAVLIATIALLLGVLVALVLSTSVNSARREEVTTQALKQTEETASADRPSVEVPAVAVPAVEKNATDVESKLDARTTATDSAGTAGPISVPARSGSGSGSAESRTEQRVPQASLRH
ncbi:hypothetical protein JGS22_014150 [Streptomyces sp. P38-E01]|uniref:Uncharacterized protein n=1 Tax=Streptomyces tardus TaxID=2780544 RepID=A0A949JHK7_9ACTN|nr:hypothetical protein [Streptomyces tardus]MBU7598724.1 hypothetical protein [Streptomyces tardus]